MLPRGSMAFSKNEIWTDYFTSSAKNILEKVRNWKLCVFLLVIVWKTMIFQHKTIPKPMGKSMKSWFFTKIHQKLEISKKYFFDRFFYILWKFSWQTFWYHVDADLSQLSIPGIFSSRRHLWKTVQSWEKIQNFFPLCYLWAAQL